MPPSTPTSDFVIAEPPAENALTGGYLFNRRIVEGSAGAGTRVAGLGARGARVVVLDSLWLATRAEDAVAAARAASDPAARIAWLLHGLPSLWRDGARLPSDAECAALAAADAILAPGGFLPRLVARSGVRRPTFLRVPGVDAVASPAVPEDPPVVLTVANVTRVKGLDVLAEALAQVKRPCRWRVVGALAESGPEADFVSALRAQLPPHATLVGPLAPAALAAEYARASLFVLPSRSENAPLTLREALAAGVPVVATSVGGVDELITDGVDGLLVPPEDPATLAAAIDRLLAPTVQPRFAAAARARGVQLPSWSAAGAAFASACRSIAAL